MTQKKKQIKNHPDPDILEQIVVTKEENKEPS